MLTRDQIINHLQDYNLKAVAKGAGISYPSLHRFVNDPDNNSRGTTIRLLSDYLIAKAERVIDDECAI